MSDARHDFVRRRRSSQTLAKSFIACLALTVSASALPFNVDSFHTGMILNEVTSSVEAQGWTLAPHRTVAGAYLEAHYDGSGQVTGIGPASFTFCNGRLIAYIRSIDFDTEYPMKLRDLLGAYGNQPRITVVQDPWNGPGGGYISSVRMQWSVSDGERVDLEFIPEGRTGNGALKNSRVASVSYVRSNNCPNQ